MRQKLKFVLVTAVLVAGAFSGCAPSWQITHHRERSLSGGYSIAPPRNWMVLQKDDDLVLTRHGIGLELIALERRNIKEPFGQTKLMLRQNMKPHELAEVVLGNFRSSPEISEFQIVAIDLAPVCTHDAFKATLKYSCQNVEHAAIAIGFLDGMWYYELWYSAPTRHYFERYRDEFDSVVKSFSLRNGNCDGSRE